MSSNCSPVWQIKFKLDYVGEKYEWGNKESFVQQLFLVAFEGRWHFWEAEPFKSLTRNTFLFRFQNVPLLSYQLFIRLIWLACLCYIILFLNCFVTTHCHHGRINWTEHTTNLDGNLTRHTANTWTRCGISWLLDLVWIGGFLFGQAFEV